jgi:hypothetical protein
MYPLSLTGEYPAIPALQGGVKGYNIKKHHAGKLRPLGRRALITGFVLSESIRI